MRHLDRGVRQTQKPPLLREGNYVFKNKKDAINNLAETIRNRLHKSGWKVWIRSPSVVSRYVQMKNRGLGSDFVYYEIRVSDHDPTTRKSIGYPSFNLSIDIRPCNENHWEKADHKLRCRQIDGECLIEQDCYDETVNSAVESAENVLGTRTNTVAWDRLEEAYAYDQPVKGRISTQKKGGFDVELEGDVRAFLPRSQADVPESGRGYSPYFCYDKWLSEQKNIVQLFKIQKLDRRHGNIVVSSCAFLEKEKKHAEQRAQRDKQLAEAILNLSEGQIVEGLVTNIDPGKWTAFVDLGGIDGKLHIKDTAWCGLDDLMRLKNKLIKVKILKIRQNELEVHVGMNLDSAV